MTPTRADALNFTKTAFGLSTGRIRESMGEALAVANALMAFEVMPELIAEGLLSSPASDLTERSDYRVLFSHSEVMSSSPRHYADSLSEEDLAITADCAESFFTAIVKDPQVIPMTREAKYEVLQSMINN